MNDYKHSRSLYQGVFIAAPTPMRPDFSIDPQGFPPLIERLAEAGLGPGDAAYTVLGAGGEHMALTVSERKAVAEAAVSAAAGKVAVFIGVTHPSTALTIKLARHAEEIGADGLQVEPPYYFTGTSDDTYAYYRAVSESTGLGIAAYNTPWTSNFDMDRRFLDRLATLENVIGLKWYAANLNEYIGGLHEFSKRFRIVTNMSGALAASAFMLGACGYVSQGANVLPRTNAKILYLLREERWREATMLYMESEWQFYQLAHRAIAAGIHGEGNFIKAALAAAGIDCGPARPPHRAPPDWFVPEVQALLEIHGEQAPEP